MRTYIVTGVRLDWNRLISLFVAVTYLVLAAITGGIETAFKVSLFLILPMAGIWFGDTLGAYTGGLARHRITQKSPGSMVTFAAWILLLSPVIAAAISLTV